MKAMILESTQVIAPDTRPLMLTHLPDPEPKTGEILIRVSVCGVCHTELDQIEGRIMPSRLPVIPGHQLVGRVAALGPGVDQFSLNDRVGVAWINSACGDCEFCNTNRENLCVRFKATGRDVDGGYAEFMAAPAAFAYHIPKQLSDRQAAPLLCAGAIGYRSLNLAMQNAKGILGLSGFGASAHLVLKLVRFRWPEIKVFVFARNPKQRQHALELGAAWAGDISEEPPALIDSLIDTTPAWFPIMEGLKKLKPGGRLVINAIRKEEADKSMLLGIHYHDHLWMEKEIKSVANVTRKDVQDFLGIAAEIPLTPDVQTYHLEEANNALIDMKRGQIRGAKILQVGS